MAGERIWKITVKWKNDAYFEVDGKLDEQPQIIVMRLEENTHYKDCREQLEKICHIYLDKVLKVVSDDMNS